MGQMDHDKMKPKDETPPNFSFKLEGVENVVGLPNIAQWFFAYKWIEYHSGNGQISGIVNVPQRLRTLLFSPTLNLVVKKTADAIVGNGLRWDTENPTLDNWFRNLIKRDPHTKSLDNFFVKIAQDFTLFNAYTFECAFEAFGLESETDPFTGQTTYIQNESLRKIVGLRYVNNEKFRLGRPCNDFDEIKEGYLSNDWDRYLIAQRFKPTKYKLFCADDLDNEGCDHLLYHNRDMKYGANWYAIPDYWGVIPDIQNDAMFPIYRNQMLKNNAIIGFVIKHATPRMIKQQNEEKDMFEFDFGGVQMAGKTLHIFASPASATGQVTLSDVEVLSHADNVGLYNQTNEFIKKNITDAFGIPPALVGQNQENLFSDREAIKAQYMLWDKQVLEPKRRMIIDPIQELLVYNRTKDPRGFPVSDEDIESLYFESFDVGTWLGIIDGSIESTPPENPMTDGTGKALTNQMNKLSKKFNKCNPTLFS